MYNPPAFREESPATLHAFVRAHPLATLVTAARDGLFASHLPMLLDVDTDGRETLLCHVARANPHWKLLAPGVESLAVFGGPNAYVSPNWYPGKHVDGRQVPTWNYVAVHAHGTAEAFDDPDQLLALLERLTLQNEARSAQPWKVSDAPADYIRAQLRAIVGVRIPVARMEGKWKMSQNRTIEDRAGARAGLAASEAGRDREVAALMRV